MIEVTNHYDRLEKFYLAKGMIREDAAFFASQKIHKLSADDDDLSYERWLKNLLEFVSLRLGIEKQDMVVVDFGCGSGELVLLLRGMGFRAYGYDIYEAELTIGRLLARDNKITDQIFFSDQEALFSHLEGHPINVLTSFSVLEHLSDQALITMFDDFKEKICGYMFHLVPSKFKISDDHTGLKFLGILPRWAATLVVRLRRKTYKLSENNDWDVWYRGLRAFQRLAKDQGLQLELARDDLVYPPLETIPLIGSSADGSAKWVLVKIYAWAISFFTREQDNLRPYLNFFIGPITPTSSGDPFTRTVGEVK